MQSCWQPPLAVKHSFLSEIKSNLQELKHSNPFYINAVRDQPEFKLEGGGGVEEKMGDPESYLFGLIIASNRTIIPEICCCDVFWCEEQCLICLAFVVV